MPKTADGALATAIRRAGGGAALAIAALMLVPLVGFVLPFGTGLMVQAILVLTILGFVGFLGHGGLPTPPRVATVALGLWTLAAVWGAIIGLVAQNPLRTVAGQLFAMLVLPLAVLVFGRLRDFTPSTLIRGLSLGAVVAIAATMVRGGALVEGRLRVAHNESLADAGLLLLLLAVVVVSRRGGLPPIVGAVLGLVVVAVSQSRGQWLAAGAALAVLAALGTVHRPLRRATQAAVVGAIAIWLGSGFISLLARPPAPLTWIDPETPLVVSPDGARRMDVVPALEIGRGRVAGLELTARVAGDLGGRAIIFVDGRARGLALQRHWSSVSGTGAEALVRVVVSLPPRVRTVNIGMMARHGEFQLLGLEIGELRYGWQVSARAFGALPSSARSAGSDQQIQGLARLVRRGDQALRSLRMPQADETVRYRLAENAAVLEDWRTAGIGRRLAGHGLGALIRFDNPSWSPEGERVIASEANYLHNIYAFLMFKLGLVGVLAGLAWVVFAVASIVRGLRGPPSAGSPAAGSPVAGPPAAWIDLAVGAVWIGYLVWGLTSSEIIDFRTAPLLGALIALSGRAFGDQRQA